MALLRHVGTRVGVMTNPEHPYGDVFLPSGTLRLEVLTEPAAYALRESVRFARETRWESVRSPHVFMGLLASPDAVVTEWGVRLGEDLAGLLEKFREAFFQKDGDPALPLALHREFLSDNVLKLLRAARARSAASGRTAAAPTDLLVCMLSAPNSIVAHCVGHFGAGKRKNLVELAVLAERQARPT
jgi:hypothetical protein